MAIKDTLPGIARAALEIARDNGGINCERTETDLYADLDKFFRDRTPEHSGLASTLAMAWSDISRWLAALSDDVLMAVCAGEEREVEALLIGSPRGTDDLLNDIFESIA